ncbi:MAG TPA: His/Gly/Thr/Pro-type tRNA ligase C-terminal domain-containing protein, partial [bacterium]|nr:His/Gly/Thr/Pro-type tRNA ligase C-terminal domain-containing protein [bacterium]
AIIEGSHDDRGIIWPVSVAPFHATVVPVNMSDSRAVETANKIHDEFESSEIEVLFDNREESAGVKFADADLIGIPYRITLGRRLVEGKVEVMERKTRKTYDVEAGKVKDFMLSAMKQST